ncbi:MAG: winged helix DNA-binding domain-containing protein [Hamadaea sp.]|uniref:winged helix DNA-binding domain-containing protein n=1 Tax=Hamadaea sp. TaxID=2024425 RepID=UPI0017D0E021|nr:winged helix DNA-binding domain-containing protein [Hamadaea sp.]NUR72157.1 winged helix DNA-binding domain-containing protein [Hamadaea sp.]NUT22724.1 winged helix DNA-binding domain-containing protein [Hamadaea sp.]
MSVSWGFVSGRRLERHGLTTPVADVATAARAMCGTHAQVLSAAELSIGLRLDGGTRQDVQDALWSDRTLVKTFGPRGTVHLLPTEDLARWCGALGAIPSASPFAAGVRVTPEQAEELITAIGAILAEGEFTVDELTAALGVRVGAWAVEPVMPAFQTLWPRWRQITHLAAHRGALCFGPNKGRNVTYTNPARWLPGFTPAPAAESTAWLLHSYLYAYGPAAPQHFARWLAAPPRWAAAVFADGDVEEVSLEGVAAWVNRGDMEFPAAATGVRLLPHFDAYAVGGQPRELLFPGEAAKRALAGSQAGNHPVLLVDGVVAGVWHQKRSGKKVAITVDPLTALTTAQRKELEEQADRVGEILGLKPSLTIDKVTVGPHA